MNRISLSRAQTYVNRQTSVALHRQHFRGAPGKEKDAELSAEKTNFIKTLWIQLSYPVIFLQISAMIYLKDHVLCSQYALPLTTSV